MDKVELEKLKKIWDNKLEKSLQESTINQAFHSPYENTLRPAVYRQKDENTYNQVKLEYYKNKEQYYRLAGQFLYSHPFESKKDQFIWEKHAEGVTIRDIVKQGKRFKLTRMTTNRVIIKLKKVMMGT